MVSVDLFTVPTVRFQVLHVFLVLARDQRRVLHFNATGQPMAEWTAEQLSQAFRWDTAPRYLRRDRGRIFGDDFTRQVQDIGINEVPGGAALALATSLIGPRDRRHSPRVPGPRDRLQ